MFFIKILDYLLISSLECKYMSTYIYIYIASHHYKHQHIASTQTLLFQRTQLDFKCEGTVIYQRKYIFR